MIRVFPRKTNATPNDDLCRFDVPTMFEPEDHTVCVSVTFKWDIPRAEFLANAWSHYGDVLIGGVAYGDRGWSFVKGRFLKNGYTITSRGCPNKCWFCDVWRREGKIRELPIVEGNNLLDSNILACSEEHIKNVFNMLKKQTNVQFTGGLEAARLREWHVNELTYIKPKQMFFAYDEPCDLDPLYYASIMLQEAGFRQSSKSMRCYVLCGYNGDTISKADKRMRETLFLGFIPMAMVYQKNNEGKNIEWSRFQRSWSRPSIIRVPKG